MPSYDGNETTIPQRVGLLAGWGRYPIVIAPLRAQGREVIVSASRACRSAACRGVPRFPLVGPRPIRQCDPLFPPPCIVQGTMAGKIPQVFMFQPLFIVRNIPDLTTIRAFVPHFLTKRKDCKDDSLLGCVVDLFASAGIDLRPATDYAPELLVKQGQLTQRGPTTAQWKDIQFGWRLAKEMGRLDVGQSVAVKNQAALAVEAVEGTDLCIRRAGSLCPAGEFTIVKVAKPQQDMRFDVPTIGGARSK